MLFGMSACEDPSRTDAMDSVKVKFSVDGGHGQLKAKVEDDGTEHTNGTTGIGVKKGKRC